MRIFTDLWTFIPRRITCLYTVRPSPQFQLVTGIINDAARDL